MLRQINFDGRVAHRRERFEDAAMCALQQWRDANPQTRIINIETVFRQNTENTLNEFVAIRVWCEE